MKVIENLVQTAAAAVKKVNTHYNSYIAITKSNTQKILGNKKNDTEEGF